MPKPPRGDAALTPVLVNLHSPGVHLEGSLTTRLHADGEGVHRGYSFTEDAFGVILRKPEAGITKRIPWAGVRDVDLVEGE